MKDNIAKSSLISNLVQQYRDIIQISHSIEQMDRQINVQLNFLFKTAKFSFNFWRKKVIQSLPFSTHRYTLTSLCHLYCSSMLFSSSN